jgi:hypothetical protein
MLPFKRADDVVKSSVSGPRKLRQCEPRMYRRDVSRRLDLDFRPVLGAASTA